jgi:hypothetical protein
MLIITVDGKLVRKITNINKLMEAINSEAHKEAILISMVEPILLHRQKLI